MRVLFLGYTLPDLLFEEVMRTDRAMPVQTQRFGSSIVRALQLADVDVSIISAEPVADFPHNSRWRVRGHAFSHPVRGTSLEFINVTGLKHVTRYISARRALRKVPRCGADVILIHGVHSPFLWAGLSAGRRLGVPVVVILTDAPGLRTPYDSALSGLLKAVDQFLIRTALKRITGVVTLSPVLAKMLTPRKPCMVMEGVAEPVGDPELHTTASVCRVVYAGGLNEQYGTVDLLDSVQFARENWNLMILGGGPSEAKVRAAAAGSPRIHYGGTVRPDEMADVYAHADVLVNPRPPRQALALESFPSKLLEYMAAGVPVVTTHLPNLPDDYLDHVVIAESGPSGLAEAIDRVARLSNAERRRVGGGAREFILRTRGADAQGHRLRGFLTDVISINQSGAIDVSEP